MAARKTKNPSVLFDPAEPPKRPSHRPWLGRFLFGYFFPRFKQCLAPHGTLECACRWSCGRRGKTSKNLVMECQVFSTIEHCFL